MDEQGVKEKIAFQHGQEFKRKYPYAPDDPACDWKFACNVWEHFQRPIDPTCTIWLAEREEYKKYEGYFQ